MDQEPTQRVNQEPQRVKNSCLDFQYVVLPTFHASFQTSAQVTGVNLFAPPKILVQYYSYSGHQSTNYTIQLSY